MRSYEDYCTLPFTYQSTSAIAPTQVSVVLTWTCSLYSLILSLNEHFIRTPAWKQLITTFALLLDALLDSQVDIKSTLRKSAVVQARRAVRSVGFIAPSSHLLLKLPLETRGDPGSSGYAGSLDSLNSTKPEGCTSSWPRLRRLIASKKCRLKGWHHQPVEGKP